MKTISALKLAITLACGALAAACTSTLPPPPPAEAPPAPVAAVPACADRNFPVYFEPDETDLNDAALAVIERAIDEAQQCQLSAIEIVAQSDAIGAADVNMNVSQDRADAVLEALLAAELDVARIAIVALGEANALTEDALINPMNRRVDVWFRE